MNIFYILLLSFILATPLPAWAVNIFACEPEWGALAEEIAGEKANITNATHAHQDPHHIRARPSLMAAIRKADIVICSGGGLEIGWMPILLQRAPASVQPGQVGHIAVTEYVNIMGIPEVIDRSHGDVHPEGNPHVHLNPHNITKAAEVLTERLQQVDAANASFYTQGAEDFLNRWNASIPRWEAQVAALNNMPIVVHHTAWLYLEDWLGLYRVASLEPKPGIPPSISHLENVLGQVKAQPVKAIIRTPYEEENASEWLAEKTGVKALVLPYTVGGADGVDTLEELFDHSLTLLLGKQ